MAHPDLDLLLNTLLPAARGLLEQHGSFHPFGAYLDEDGEVVQVDAEITGESAPHILDSISERLRDEARSGRARATALCMDVLVVPPEDSEKTDAIGLRLEHVGGEAIEVFLPYLKSDPPELLLEQLFATPGYRTNFGEGEESENLTRKFGLPDDLDGRTLAQLRQAGSSLTREHELDFFLYFKEEEPALSVASILEKEGFAVQCGADDEGQEWLVLGKKRLVPEHAQLLSLRRHFSELCARHGGDYDGWGTDAVQG